MSGKHEDYWTDQQRLADEHIAHEEAAKFDAEQKVQASGNHNPFGLSTLGAWHAEGDRLKARWRQKTFIIHYRIESEIRKIHMSRSKHVQCLCSDISNGYASGQEGHRDL